MEPAELKRCFTSFKRVRWKHVGHFDGFETYAVTRNFQREKLRFLLRFDQDFPDSLPLIYLLKAGDQLDNIPHLMEHLQVCYLDQEGIMWDDGNPVGVIEESIEKAFQTATKSMSGESDQDYLREFDYHWQKIQKARPAVSLVGDLKGPQLIVRALWNDWRIIGHTLEQINNYADRIKVSMDQAMIEKMLYIPLTTANGIRFKRPWDLPELRRVIFGNIGFTSRIKNLLSSDRNLPVYITMPASPESRVHLAAEFIESRQPIHPLLNEKAAGSFQAIFIHRMDMEYLLPRGGVRKNLSDKKVGVIGCGAIGGIVAQELANAGITDMLLIDHDIFDKDNLYRHVLGMPYIGHPKVNALKDKLEKCLPHVNITAIAKPFAEVKRQQSVDFSDYGLLIDATAVVPASTMISRFFIHNHPGLPVLHTWLEALGIGGHAMVTNNGGAGCYKCLYSVRDPELGIYNRASFAAKGQSFSKSMFGCAGRFTPFSSLDAHKTATLAVELALKVLSGEERGHPLLSWKGDPKYFLEAGYTLSDRYKNFTEEELYQSRYDYVSETCLLCTKVPA